MAQGTNKGNDPPQPPPRVKHSGQQNPVRTGSRFSILNQNGDGENLASQDMELEGNLEQNLEGDQSVDKAQEYVNCNPQLGVEIMGKNSNYVEGSKSGENHIGLREDIMESLPITVDLANNEDPLFKERRSFTNWKEDGMAHEGVMLGPNQNRVRPLRENSSLNNTYCHTRDEKEKIVNLSLNGLISSEKENCLDSTPINTRLKDPSNQLAIEGENTESFHESPRHPNYPRDAGTSGILDVHRLRHRGPIDGQGASSSPQGGATGRLIPSPKTQSAGFAGYSTTPDGVNTPHERPLGRIHGYSA